MIVGLNKLGRIILFKDNSMISKSGFYERLFCRWGRYQSSYKVFTENGWDKTIFFFSYGSLVFVQLEHSIDHAIAIAE